APLSGGRMHLLVKQGRFTRRMIFARDTVEGRAQALELHTRETLALLVRPRTESQRRSLWSWWNPATPYYYPRSSYCRS
ncbi:MAG: hypothetical protein P1V35_16160, partial [Planctomycetota bacterium]|nr:hypothetical protein [Planctomycetota bacterium]